MSIWGNLIGGYLGFSIAGPIGALIGSIIGGKISSRKKRFQENFTQTKQIFAVSLVILTAKLAKVDGHVSKEELVAIKQKLKIRILILIWKQRFIIFTIYFQFLPSILPWD